jgi:phosphoglycerate dehydrogenase-like enzyme
VFRLWFERGLPPELGREIEGRAVALAPGPPGDRLATAADADGIVASSLLDYDAVAFDRVPRLRVISRTGIGVDRIDVAEATRRKIVVCNAPDGPTLSTAEHTIALLLAVTKRLKRAENRLRAGAADSFAAHDAIELAGRTIGLIGFGRIGRRVAALTRGIGMRAVAFDPHIEIPPDEAEAAAGLMDLLASCDVVSLHTPLTAETRHLIDRSAFEAMRPGTFLLNAARGGLVDHEAMIEALEHGRLGGAGLDVTEPEPLPPDHPLLARDDVVVTPHVAAATREGKRRLTVTAIHEALAVLEGRDPEHPINPEALQAPRERTSKGA